LQNRRHLALGQQIDLQVEVRALVGLRREAILAGQDEQREEDGLERHYRGQQGKRERIERTHRRDEAEIQRRPHAEPHEVGEEYWSAPRLGGDPLADALRA